MFIEISLFCCSYQISEHEKLLFFIGLWPVSGCLMRCCRVLWPPDGSKEATRAVSPLMSELFSPWKAEGQSLTVETELTTSRFESWFERVSSPVAGVPAARASARTTFDPVR